MAGSKNQIYLIESKSCQGLADMFMRFQEHYESPEFKGKTFSIDEFAAWYASQNGAFTYSRDWYGFNIPITVLEPFRAGNFNPLTIEEKQLLGFCTGAHGDSYIIGATSSDEEFGETVKHEFAHGAFYTNSDYRNEVISCVKNYKIKEINTALSDFGYHQDVAIDETNAYILVEPETIENYISVNNTDRLRQNLKRIFSKHFGFSLPEIKTPALLSRTEHILV